MIVPGMLVCSSFSNKCVYVYWVKSFAHIKCYSYCSRMGGMWLNPFATVLFTLCNAVTVVLCFVLVLCGCFCGYVRKKAFSSVCNY